MKGQIDYRGFVIGADSFFPGKFQAISKEYNGEGDPRLFYGLDDIDRAKQAFDFYLYCNIKVFVHTGIPGSFHHNITPFRWFSDALAFAGKVNGDIKFTLNGFEIDQMP